MKKVLITSALLYANGPLHFGHIAGAYLPGDCYARFERLLASDVLYLSGSDEYGVAITLSAELEGHSPKEHVDKYHKINQELFSKLNFSFDHYSRTTWEGHQAPTLAFFSDLLENGYIEERVTEHLYDEKNDRFLADRYVVGTCPKCAFEEARGDECPSCAHSYDATDLLLPRSKISGSKLSLKPTKHWYLRLDLFRERLLDWIATKDWKPNVVNFVTKIIEDFHASPITRDLSWGIPVPLEGAEGKVIYVWFDAPIGYISAAMDWAEKMGNKEAWKDYWLDESTRLVHFIGKDNIPFHAAIFPAMLMGQNTPYKLVDALPANEFYKLEGKQFSKSDGWYIDFEDFFKNYTADQIRYTIAANAPESSDTEFTWKDFQMRCNAELLGKYGNLANRALTFLQKYLDGKVPVRSEITEEDEDFLEANQKIVTQAKEAYANFRLRKASQLIMELAQLGNGYFEKNKPWVLEKNGEKERLASVLHNCLLTLRNLALISYPIIPETAEKLFSFLAMESILENSRFDEIFKADLKAGASLPKPSILFRKLEDEEIEKELLKLKKRVKKSPPPQLKETISIDDFRKLDLRVGTILKAEKLAKSKKLLELEVDIGLARRKILSGISKQYSPEELLGKKVVVLANLKAAKIMGIESEGMLLAGSLDDALELLSVEHLPAGSLVS